MLVKAGAPGYFSQAFGWQHANDKVPAKYVP